MRFEGSILLGLGGTVLDALGAAADHLTAGNPIVRAPTQE
jgi:hypothetical protein